MKGHIHKKLGGQPIRRIKEKITCKKGFTLIEMIIATALVGMMFTMVAAIVPTWYKAYHTSMELNHARQIADSIMGTIEEKLRFANEVKIPDGSSTSTYITGRSGSSSFQIPMEPLEGESGEHFRIDGLVYDEDYLMGNKVELQFTKVTDAAGQTAYKVTVKLTEEDGTPVLSKTRTVGLYGKND